MPIATGVAKQLRYKKESTWGALAGASGAQLLRRVTSDISLAKETYESQEIRSDYQVTDSRHGVRRVEGTINGEISPLTYVDFWAAALRAAFSAGGTTTSTGITASASAPHFVRTVGSWISDGHKIGHVVRATGFATATANNGKNFLITGLTALNMTGVFLDGSAVVAEAAGASVTIEMEGKQTFTPQTGHTDDSFNIEHWHSDITQSEVYTGCKIQQVAVNLPPTGISTIALQMVGKDLGQSGTSAYFTSPQAETSSGVLAAVNGAIYVGGTKIALLTGLQFTISGGMTQEPVVGSNTYPDIFEGRVRVSGQMTAFFEDGTLRDYFTNESEVSLYGVFTTSNAPDADFIAFVMPRIKAGGSSKDDGEKGIVQTIPFTALLNIAGGTGASSLRTTLSVQDSLAP